MSAFDLAAHLLPQAGVLVQPAEEIGRQQRLELGKLLGAAGQPQPFGEPLLDLRREVLAVGQDQDPLGRLVAEAASTASPLTSRTSRSPIASRTMSR